jgi:hypothetical protein
MSRTDAIRQRLAKTSRRVKNFFRKAPRAVYEGGKNTVKRIGRGIARRPWMVAWFAVCMASSFYGLHTPDLRTMPDKSSTFKMEEMPQILKSGVCAPGSDYHECRRWAVWDAQTTAELSCLLEIAEGEGWKGRPAEDKIQACAATRLTEDSYWKDDTRRDREDCMYQQARDKQYRIAPDADRMRYCMELQGRVEFDTKVTAPVLLGTMGFGGSLALAALGRGAWRRVNRKRPAPPAAPPQKTGNKNGTPPTTPPAAPQDSGSKNAAPPPAVPPQGNGGGNGAKNGAPPSGP